MRLPVWRGRWGVPFSAVPVKPPWKSVVVAFGKPVKVSADDLPGGYEKIVAELADFHREFNKEVDD